MCVCVAYSEVCACVCSCSRAYVCAYSEGVRAYFFLKKNVCSRVCTFVCVCMYVVVRVCT